jgi:DNA-binding transcriptional LysR family regulator
MSIELRQMRYFTAVVEHGQISSAARALHLAQPALSQSIAGLERELGVELLTRHPRGVAPTPAGAAFYARACESITAADRAAVDARAQALQLTIGFIPGGLFAGMPVIDEFRRRRPEAALTISELNFANRLRLLRSHRLDAEILGPITNVDDLYVELLHSSPRVVLLSPDHRLAGRRSVAFADIADETFPGGHPDIPIDWLDFNWCTAERGRRPRMTAETPLTPEECVPLLGRGDVVAVGPAFLAESLRSYGVVSVPVTDIGPYTFGIACRADDRRPTILALMDLARELAD